MENRNF